MDGEQISNISSSNYVTQPFFRGVFANYNLPRSFSLHNNAFIIVNTLSRASEEMGHWIVLYIRDGILHYFDSLAACPTQYGGAIHKLYSDYPREKIIVFDNPLQSDTSFACGAYAIFFLQ